MGRVSVLSERSIVTLVGAIHLINVLEFMMVMPLGPDFGKALGIASYELGYVSSSYTLASALAGLISSYFIERFDRRWALAVAMGGLILSTMAATIAFDLETLILTRVLAGLFGGPSVSLSLAIIAETIPVERRGRAMGSIFSTFSIASLVGVPLGLELARLAGWRAPFFAVSLLGIFVVTFATLMLPPMRRHLMTPIDPSTNLAPPSQVTLWRRPDVILALLSCGLMMISGFLLVPNLAPYIQDNLNFPRENLGSLYLVGGLVSFLGVRMCGILIDRVGALAIGLAATLLFVTTVFMGFVMVPPPLPVMVIFAGFMVAMSVRGVAFNTLSSLVPGPHERARYMSLQSAVHHLASAAGAALASHHLTTSAEKQLIGMTDVAWFAMGCAGLMPLTLALLNWVIRKRPQTSNHAPTASTLSETSSKRAS